jgi:TIR domain
LPDRRHGVFRRPAYHPDESFVLFLKRFSRHTELLTTLGAPQFAATLAAAWKDRSKEKPGGNEGEDEDEEPMAEGSVFISYPSEDREAAAALRQQLRELGIRAWLDREKLEGGDAYGEKIRTNVERSGYFLAVISKNTQTEEKRWFRKEWQWALDAAAQLDESDRFIVPVVVDETDHTAKRLPQRFRDVHWLRSPGGNLSSEQKAQFRSMFVKAMTDPVKP